MKKLILSIFIFCSVFASAQISIPQVTGLPAALNSKVDKVSGKSLVADTLSAKIQPTAVAVATKEPLLPSTPSSPESKFLNGNRQWAEIVLGSGGYASNVYFTNLTSTIVGTYKQTSGTHELTETIASGTCNNNEVLIHTYLFEQPVGITTVDAGVWRFTMNCAINSNVGDSKFKIVQFKRSSTGVETDMFTIYSNTIENTDYQNFIIETVQPSFLVDSLDHFGCRVYATTTTTVNKTISYKVGDGYASYLNTPLALRHDQNRDKNGNPLYQHVTTSDISKWNTTSLNNTVDETLTSIKTKLGAASSVSDGYLRYQDFALLHTPTTVTASNGLSISGQNISLQNASLTQSGALTFNDWNTFNSKEPAITKNSGFNLPLGTTPGTVLEGRTFGTAANNAVGDFVQNGTGAQSANFNINGSGALGAGLTAKAVSANIQLVLGRTGDMIGDVGIGSNSNSYISIYDTSTLNSLFSIARSSGAASFSSTLNSTGFLLNGNNLTSSLTSNHVVKWNGTNLVNSGIYDNAFWGTVNMVGTGVSYDWAILHKDATGIIRIPKDTYNVEIPAATVSTTPTNGALVVGGGVGADHVRANNFYGSGSNLTGVQLPITLTTNGTSGAATFSGNVLNVPNYTSASSSGNYASSITLLSGLASSGNTVAIYTKNGNNYHVGLSGVLTTNATGTCSFRIQLPSSVTGSNAVVVPHIFGSSGSYIAHSYISSFGSTDVVDISFISTSASGSSFNYNVMIDYY